MPVSRLHCVKHIFDESVRHIIMKEVAHGIYEDEFAALPLEWLPESLRTELEIEATFVRVSRNTPEPLRKSLGVAVRATGADLGAARDGIPRGLGPFDP